MESERTFKIKNFVFSSSDERLSEYLESAYKRNLRPRCMCTEKGVDMYIAFQHGQHILKRMPFSGFEHHPSCPSFEIPEELSGRGQIDSKSIQENLDTGITNLKLDFSLSKNSSERTAPEPSGENNKEAVHDPNKLSILSFLHFLYEEAGLNKWSPKMGSKRHWGVVYKYLSQQASNLSAKKTNLSELLLIPAPFDKYKGSR